VIGWRKRSGSDPTALDAGEAGIMKGNNILGLALAWSALPLALHATGALAQSSATDCPSAWTRYSGDTVLLDLMLDPRARAVLDQAGILKSLSWITANPTPPTFAAIITPRRALANAGLNLPDGIDQALAGIPITREAAVRRCARYDHVAPVLPAPSAHPAILVFEKITGFRDEASVNAAHQTLIDMARRRGWSLIFTDNGAAFNDRQLKAFDAVVWNNVSGDVLTIPQQQAFRRYLARGGGFAGVHGSGGDPSYVWEWYTDQVVGARFAGHPMNPQFQSARVEVESGKGSLTAGLPDGWTMTEEWYSFTTNPRARGVHVIARLDEDTYRPGKLAMGDHPIAWAHCIGKGRSFFTAIGHRPESYSEPNSVKLLENGIAWAAGLGMPACSTSG